MESKERLEELNKQLTDPGERAEYARPYDNRQVAFLPRLFARILVTCGNVLYGRKPSYLKFRAIEVIARVPYQSWVSAAYTLLTLFYSNEARALTYSNVSHFARIAQDNETMHVVVISALAKKERKSGIIRYTLVPMLFAFVYFWVSYLLYLMNRRHALELNYCFESHAYEQYSDFLERYESELKAKPITSDFLAWYGRFPLSQYEFFESVRNDELIHRNTSYRAAQEG